jgi:enterochelin esterase family protein
MSRHRTLAAALILVMAASIGVATAQRPPAAPNFDAFYELRPRFPGPAAACRKEKVAGPFTLPSTAFPGVDHDYWVYVPAQYDGKTEVSLMVFNDGATYLQADGYYRAVNVLDNLIYRRELPLMIAAFIDPGKFRADGKSNRQPEYDPQPTAIRKSSSTSSCRSSMPTIGFRASQIATGSAAGARAPSRRSRWRGSGPISSGKVLERHRHVRRSLRRDTCIRRKSWRATASRSGSS